MEKTMDRNGEVYRTYVEILERELVCAMGCTEPIAIAYCAAKIAVAVESGLLGYEMYQNGQQFYDGDGLVLKGVENTIRNYGYLGRVAMHETNTEIIHMMIEPK